MPDDPLEARRLNDIHDLVQSITHATPPMPERDWPIFWFKLSEAIGPAADFVDRDGVLQRYDLDDWVDTSPAEHHKITDPTGSLYFPAGSIIACWPHASGHLIPLDGHATSMLCKATAALDEGPADSNFLIWSGTIADGEDSGIATLPAIELQRDIEDNEFFLAHFVNGGWIVPKGGEGGGSTIKQSTLTADCAIGAPSADVDGEDDPVANPMGYGGASGSVVHYTDIDGTKTVIGIQLVAVDLDKNVADTGPKVVQTKVAAGIHAVSTEGDTSDVFEWDNCVPDEE
jgi:hypothetical protein